MSKKKETLLYFILSCTLLLIAIIAKNGMLLALLGVLFNICIIIKMRKCQLLLMISLFMAMYSIPPMLFFCFDINLSAYTAFNSSENYFFTLLVHTIYLFFFSLALNTKQVLTKDHNLKVQLYDSSLAYSICIVGVVATILIGRTGQSIFTRGGYGSGGEHGGSALYEYCYIFYFLAYVFSGGKQNRTIILKILFALYTIKGVLFGARIELLAMVILVYICFYRDRFRTKTIIALAFGFWVLFSIFGNFRANLSFDYKGIAQLYGYNTDLNRIVNNESEVLYTSTVMLTAVKNGFLSSSYRLNATINYFIRLIIPSSLVSSNYNIIPYLQKNYSASGGGGFFSSFLYVYGGWIGVCIGAILSACIWNSIEKTSENKSFKQIFVLISIVMTPRWFAYSPEAIVKIPLYTVIGFIILKELLGLQPINKEIVKTKQEELY